MSRNVYLVGSVPMSDAPEVFEKVSAALGPEAGLDQFNGQVLAEPDVIGAEQAVMGQAQRLGQEFRIGRGPGPDNRRDQSGHRNELARRALLSVKCIPDHSSAATRT